MIIKYGVYTMEIGDDSEEAQKIERGFKYEIIDGVLNVLDEPSDGQSLRQLKRRIEQATTIDDIKIILKKIIKII